MKKFRGLLWRHSLGEKTMQSSQNVEIQVVKFFIHTLQRRKEIVLLIYILQISKQFKNASVLTKLDQKTRAKDQSKLALGCVCLLGMFYM